MNPDYPVTPHNVQHKLELQAQPMTSVLSDTNNSTAAPAWLGSQTCHLARGMEQIG